MWQKSDPLWVWLVIINSSLKDSQRFLSQLPPYKGREKYLNGQRNVKTDLKG